MKEIILHVYDKAGNVTKECKAGTCNIMFGTVRKLMKLFKVDELENTAQILKIVAGAWDDVTAIMGECFPEMEDEDWDCVMLKELVPCMIAILKDSFLEIMNIPKDPKAKGE